MAKQTVTIRLDEDDLTYLAGLEVAGATNLSEKIRSLLAEARLQREGVGDALTAHAFSERLLQGTMRAIREAESQTEMRSELLSRVMAWLPDLLALLLAGGGRWPKSAQADQLRKVERGVGERVLSLVDSMVQQAVAGFPGCYDSSGLTERAQTALRVIGGGTVTTSSMSTSRPDKGGR